jgi:hypothetical protein
VLVSRRSRNRSPMLQANCSLLEPRSPQRERLKSASKNPTCTPGLAYAAVQWMLTRETGRRPPRFSRSIKSIRNGCSSTIFMYRLVAPSRWADSKLLCCSDSMCQRQTKTCWRQRTLHSSASDPNPHILSQNSCSPPLPRTSQSPPKTDSRVETSTTGRRPLRLEISGHTGY